MNGAIPYTSLKWPTLEAGTPRIAFVLRNFNDQPAYEVAQAVNQAVINNLNVNPLVFYYEQGNSLDILCCKIHVSQIWGYTGIVVHTDNELAKKFDMAGMPLLYCYKNTKESKLPIIVRSPYYNKLNNTNHPVMSRLDIPSIFNLVKVHR